MTKEEHAKVLPPLPMPFIKLQGRNSRTKAQSEMMELFSADQMREYALAAIMRKEPQGWMPIETAPKDEPILVGPTKRMGICVAMNDSRDGWVTETCSEWINIYTPTHWMPLPPPPALLEKK